MVEYTCENCLVVFKHKGHYTNHIHRKHSCKKNNTIKITLETNANTIETPNVTTDIYSSKTRDELIQLCKEQNITDYKYKNKAYIINLLNNLNNTIIEEIIHRIVDTVVNETILVQGINSELEPVDEIVPVPVPVFIDEIVPVAVPVPVPVPVPVFIDEIVPAPVFIDEIVPAPVFIDEIVPAPVFIDEIVPVPAVNKKKFPPFIKILNKFATPISVTIIISIIKHYIL